MAHPIAARSHYHWLSCDGRALCSRDCIRTKHCHNSTPASTEYASIARKTSLLAKREQLANVGENGSSDTRAHSWVQTSPANGGSYILLQGTGHMAPLVQSNRFHSLPSWFQPQAEQSVALHRYQGTGSRFPDEIPCTNG
jgi:hypothetical protein